MTSKADNPNPFTAARWVTYWTEPGVVERAGVPILDLHLPPISPDGVPTPLFSRDDVPKLFPNHLPDADCERIAWTLHEGVRFAISRHLAAKNRSHLSAEIGMLTKIAFHAKGLPDLLSEVNSADEPPYGKVRALPMLTEEAYQEKRERILNAPPDDDTRIINRAIAKAECEAELLRELTALIEQTTLIEALAVLASRADWAAKRRQDQIGPGGPDGVLAPHLTAPWVFAHRLAYGTLPGKPRKITLARLRNFITLVVRI